MISFLLGQVLLGMRSQEGSHLQLGWLWGTLKVSTDTVSTWVQWHMALPHHWVRIKSWFILSGSGSAGNAVTGGFPFTARVTIGDIEGVNTYCFPPGFSGIWHFPTIGLESNLDFILSGSGSAGNAVTGGFPFTARVTIGDIEGVNGYCFHLGSVAYGTSPPLG